MPAHDHDPGPAPTGSRRSDAGVVRFTARDISGLVLAGDMYGAPYDLMETALGVKAARLRGITCRWRAAGVAQTGRVGPGPAWCWLTPAGMRAAGLRFPARRPPLARLAHIRAVLAARITLEASDEFAKGAAWWRSELRCPRFSGQGSNRILLRKGNESSAGKKGIDTLLNSRSRRRRKSSITRCPSSRWHGNSESTSPPSDSG